MEIECMALGPLETNCFILRSKTSEKCTIIDPADEGGKLENYLNKHSLQPEAVLLTHGHPDHVMAVKEIIKAFHCPVYMHKADVSLLGDRGLSFLIALTGPAGFKPDRFLSDEQLLDLAVGRLRVMYTPGHTPGSVCFYSLGSLFSGDLLFNNGVGRYDLPGGDERQVLESLGKIMELPDDTKVYPGHGPFTTIGAERRGNFFIVNNFK